jgi:hypothetical protein
MDRAFRWSLWGAMVVAGCGGRTLAGDDTTRSALPEAMNEGDAGDSPGDATTTGGDASPSMSPPVETDGSALPFFVCPPVAPALGAACDPEGLICAYDGPGAFCEAFACVRGRSGQQAPGWQSTRDGC